MGRVVGREGWIRKVYHQVRRVCWALRLPTVAQGTRLGQGTPSICTRGRRGRRPSRIPRQNIREAESGDVAFVPAACPLVHPTFHLHPAYSTFSIVSATRNSARFGNQFSKSIVREFSRSRVIDIYAAELSHLTPARRATSPPRDSTRHLYLQAPRPVPLQLGDGHPLRSV